MTVSDIVLSGRRHLRSGLTIWPTEVGTMTWPRDTHTHARARAHTHQSRPRLEQYIKLTVRPETDGCHGWSCRCSPLPCTVWLCCHVTIELCVHGAVMVRSLDRIVVSRTIDGSSRRSPSRRNILIRGVLFISIYSTNVTKIRCLSDTLYHNSFNDIRRFLLCFYRFIPVHECCLTMLLLITFGSYGLSVMLASLISFFDGRRKSSLWPCDLVSTFPIFSVSVFISSDSLLAIAQFEVSKYICNAMCSFRGFDVIYEDDFSPFLKASLS